MATPILITGVGKRAGLSLARHLLAMDKPVIGTYRTRHPEVDELQQAGAKLIQCDFYDDEQIAQLIEQVSAMAPRLRAIIHNASDWLPDNSIYSAAETMHRMMQVHVSVPFQLNQGLASRLTSDTAASADIIHISDYVAKVGSRKHIAYAASKAALDNLTLSFASALAPSVKVNSIAPALLAFNPDDDEAYRAKARSKALLQKEGGFDELIAAVDYLLNSGYVTGQILALNGGRHLKG